MGVAATSAIITWRIPDATEHATPPCVVGVPRAMSRLTISSAHAHAPADVPFPFSTRHM
jgi:hypothetical protein